MAQTSLYPFCMIFLSYTRILSLEKVSICEQRGCAIGVFSHCRVDHGRGDNSQPSFLKSYRRTSDAKRMRFSIKHPCVLGSSSTVLNVERIPLILQYVGEPPRICSIMTETLTCLKVYQVNVLQHFSKHKAFLLVCFPATILRINVVNCTEFILNSTVADDAFEGRPRPLHVLPVLGDSIRIIPSLQHLWPEIVSAIRNLNRTMLIACIVAAFWVPGHKLASQPGPCHVVYASRCICDRKSIVDHGPVVCDYPANDKVAACEPRQRFDSAG